MFNRIIVATDGSEPATRAVDVAIDLAVKYDAELAVLYVMEDIGSTRIPVALESYTNMKFFDASEREVLSSIAGQVVDRAANKAREAGVSQVEQSIEAGSPGPVIVEYAKKRDADLIVMGRSGLGRVADLLLGSVSYRTTQLASCACMTVK